MPHFVIDCSENIIDIKSSEEIMRAVYDAAESSKLFVEGDIKVRINLFKHFVLGNKKNGFVHIFAYIMQGRNRSQKASLSKKVISQLKELLPDVSIISMNITDFEKATYCNRQMLEV